MKPKGDMLFNSYVVLWIALEVMGKAICPAERVLDIRSKIADSNGKADERVWSGQR